jgi:hypothetical protein
MALFPCFDFVVMRFGNLAIAFWVLHLLCFAIIFLASFCSFFPRLAISCSHVVYGSFDRGMEIVMVVDNLCRMEWFLQSSSFFIIYIVLRMRWYVEISFFHCFF